MRKINNGVILGRTIKIKLSSYHAMLKYFREEIFKINFTLYEYFLKTLSFCTIRQINNIYKDRFHLNIIVDENKSIMKMIIKTKDKDVIFTDFESSYVIIDKNTGNAIRLS